MGKLRIVGFFALAAGCVVLALSPRHRRIVARRLADARRFVSRRIVDEEARAIETWEDEGGAPAAAREAERGAAR